MQAGEPCASDCTEAYVSRFVRAMARRSVRRALEMVMAVSAALLCSYLILQMRW